MDVTYCDVNEAMAVEGPELRTSFDTAAEDIGPFWGRFMAQGWLDRLPHSDPGALYAVYCDYASDFRGAYTMILGMRAHPAEPITPGARRVPIPSGRFAKVAFAGDPRSVVWEAWRFVNERWDRNEERRYAADYEQYSLAAMTPRYAEGEIFVGLR
jgi:predicted transcriptional regulator YdeE